MDAMLGDNWTAYEVNPNLPPMAMDIVIVGGGVMGWSIAYWLKQMGKSSRGVKVLVVERDTTVSDPVTHFKLLQKRVSHVS